MIGEDVFFGNLKLGNIFSLCGGVRLVVKGKILKDK